MGRLSKWLDYPVRKATRARLFCFFPIARRATLGALAPPDDGQPLSRGRRRLPKEKEDGPLPAMLSSEEQKSFLAGKEIYSRDGFCETCHQPDGKGLESSGFPPLAGNDWVQGDEERLIKIVLHGLYGPIELAGKKYPGQVPMTPFGGMLNDQEIADVLTYIRSSFGNLSKAVKPETVKTATNS